MTYEYWLDKEIKESNNITIGFTETRIVFMCDNCSWFSLCHKLGTPHCNRYAPIVNNYDGIEIFRGNR